jgi:hypothetical protein
MKQGPKTNPVRSAEIIILTNDVATNSIFSTFFGKAEGMMGILNYIPLSLRSL